MQAVILAAGKSERMYPWTLETPKCLLEIGNKSFLERILDSLILYDLQKVLIVVGFEGSKIEQFIRSRSWGVLEIDLIWNHVYSDTNNGYSLWLARKWLEENFLLLDSDILFDPRILGCLLESEYENCLALRKSKNLGSEEIKVKMDEQNRVLEIGKSVSVEYASGESLGIEKFSLRSSKSLVEKLEENIVQKGKTQEFYEASFQNWIDDPKSKKDGHFLYAQDIGELRGMEVDTKEDFRYAEEYLSFLL